MKLYYKPGACSMAAHIIFNEMGADYRLEKVDTQTRFTESGANYRDINPRGYVPALELDDGTVLTENAAILYYLAADHDQGHDQSQAPARLAVARQQEALSFLSSELHKAFTPFFSGELDSDAKREHALRRLMRQIDHVEAMLADGRPWLSGDSFGVVDAYAFVILNWTHFIGVALDDWPHARAFHLRVAARPATQRALAEEGLAS